MRLNKYLAQCGVGSRRKCDELINSGKVFVNGAKANLGQEINGEEDITVNGHKVKALDKLYYFILNKPKGCITTVQDDRERTTVIDIFSKAYKRLNGVNAEMPKVYPVGRLDYNTQGMLILTNDGYFANSLIHPSRKIYKTYHAIIYPQISQKEIERLESGVMIDNVKTLPAKVKILENKSSNKQLLEISIFQGRNRQVRKMLESVGANVQDLKRVAIGELKLGKLSSGQIKELTKDNVYQIFDIN